MKRRYNTMEELSIQIFGTPDYQSVLDILPPYDGMVRLWEQESKKLQNCQDLDAPGNTAP